MYPVSYTHLNLDIIDVLVIMPETIKSEWVTDTIIRYANAANIPVIMLDGSHNGCTNITYDLSLIHILPP